MILGNFQNFIFKNLLNIFLFFYLFFYIAGPALINIFLTFISLFCLIYLIKNNKTLIDGFKDKGTLTLIIFFIYALLVSILKKNFNIDIISFFRMVLIYFFITIFFKNNKYQINLKIFLPFVLIISFDSLLQYFIGYNILGFEKFDTFRLTSFFKDEPIVGSFLIKLTIPLIGIFLYSFKKEKIFFFSIILSSIIIFLSGERMPLLQYLFGIFLLIFFSKNKRKAIFALISILSLVLILFTLNNDLLDRYKSTYSTFNSIINDTLTVDDNERNPSVNEYILNFKSGLQLWSQSKVFGSGYRYYNVNCKRILSDHYYSGCSTHPHNIYIEILSDYGLLGLLIFILFIFRVLYQFYNNYKSTELIGIGILFFVLVFPLTTSQSIFSSYYGSIFFLFIFIINILNLKKEKISY